VPLQKSQNSALKSLIPLTVGPFSGAELSKSGVLAGGAPGKFVTKVSCAEAVILAYQIIFSEQDKPFFINKDAAHTMPGTLKDWLEANWETVSRGKG
jgi:hypothetical protein